MPTKLGEYSLLSGNAQVPFWPLVPGTTVTGATPVVLVAPNNPTNNNTLTPPVHFGIFDIVIEMSEPVFEQVIGAPQSDDLLLTELIGAPSITTMPLTREGNVAGTRVVNISFAVRIPAADTFFEGTLQLSARNATATAAKIKTLRLPLKVYKWTREADMFIFFIVRPPNKPPPREYCWVKVPVEQWLNAPPYPAVDGAEVKAKVLRDNYSSGYNQINRRVSLASVSSATATEAFVAYEHHSGARPVLGMPINWPIIFNATKATYVPRGHMVRLKSANIANNLNPFRASAIRMMLVSDANMTNKRVLLDSGHAVVYGYTAARRSQEWFVAHNIADRVATILQTRFNLKPQNLFRTRTAGFGLIDPGSINANGAPETGAARYHFDLANSRVRIKQGTLGLTHLSNLLLTAHDNNNNALPVAETDRNRLITINQQAVNAIIARINHQLPAGQTVQPNSVRWEVAGSRYIYTIERTHPQPGQNPIVNNAAPFRIQAGQAGDWFTLDADMMQLLIERTARWSIAKEIGSGPAANSATGRPAFGQAARDAMRAEGAFDYIVAKIKEDLSVLPHSPNHAEYVNRPTMGWHFLVRRDHLNNTNCDIYLTIHENANEPGQSSAVGTALLVTKTGPPADQVRLAKIFVKYVDPFDQGTHGGGIVGNGAGQLSSASTVRDKHAYFELEFMDTINPKNPAQYRYEQMVLSNFLDTVAEQIIAGTVEFLFDKQSDLDTVTYDGSSLSTIW